MKILRLRLFVDPDFFLVDGFVFAEEMGAFFFIFKYQSIKTIS